jgi:hypothetical protein
VASHFRNVRYITTKIPDSGTPNTKKKCQCNCDRSDIEGSELVDKLIIFGFCMGIIIMAIDLIENNKYDEDCDGDYEHEEYDERDYNEDYGR